jgi:hypothetical protein
MPNEWWIKLVSWVRFTVVLPLVVYSGDVYGKPGNQKPLTKASIKSQKIPLADNHQFMIYQLFRNKIIYDQSLLIS